MILNHTSGRRLRAAGVSYEDRQDLLGHRSSRVTAHYSAAEMGNLIEAANKVCEQNSRTGISSCVAKRRKYLIVWVDSNHRPQHYECRSVTLTYCFS